MKTLLVGINAKYIHTNLAIRYLKKYVEERTNIVIDIAEYTINQQLDDILREIYKQKPDVIGFSCYIWNFEIIKTLTFELKKLLPNTIIFLGGPEVSYNPKEVISNTACDIVIIGEGEVIFHNLISAITNKFDYTDIKGIAYRNKENIITNLPESPLDMAQIPFVYDDYSDFQNKIIYYEASRGCPFNCQYCLSGSTGGVRFLPLERVFKDLDHFLKAKVKQVKFVDRTFNCKKEYSMAIWKHLCENDNGVTNFHFEIAAELLDDEMIQYLNGARKGLFQLEIGVQSTNEETLKAIKRITLPEKLTPIIHGLQKNKNIHLHLDLIAGLPFEGYNKFKESFNYVYSLSPDQLQLGFLKLLKGSGLYSKRDEYGLVHTDFAPYEILYTKWLSHDEILRLKMIEEMVETYYNSNRYKLSINYLVSLFEHPFDFFESLASFYEHNNLHLAPHNKLEYYNYLYNFSNIIPNVDLILLKNKLLFDIYSHEKAKSLPHWIEINDNPYKKKIYDFIDLQSNRDEYLNEYQELDTKQLLRQSHIEVFLINPFTNEKKETAILFNYRRLDLLGNAEWFEINL